MAIVFCSAKLGKLLGVKNRLPSISMNNWNGHLFFLEGRKCLVFIHKETLYSFVLFNVLKKDLVDFETVFTKHLLQQLHAEFQISEKLEEAVRMDLGEVELSTTDGDKIAIGYLNDAVQRLTWPGEFHVATILEIREYVQFYYNTNPMLKRKSTPKLMMAEKLKALADSLGKEF